MAMVTEYGYYFSLKSANYAIGQARANNPGIKFAKEKDRRQGRDVWIVYQYPKGWKSKVG